MLFLTLVILTFVSMAQIDICVPSFPEIKEYFDLTPFATEAILGVNLFCNCIGALFAGMLGDKYGKKRIIEYGLIVFIAASIGCIITNNYYALLFFRALQGIGFSAPSILSSIIVFDVYPKEKQASMITMLAGLSTLFLSIAPTIGSFATYWFGWGANFVLLLILGVLCFILLKIFVPNDNKNNSRITISLREYVVIFKNLPTFFAVLIVCLEIGIYYVFTGISSIIYISSFGLTLKEFGIYQGIIMFSYSIFSISNGKFVKIFGRKSLFIFSIILAIIFSVLCLLLIILNVKNVNYISFIMIVFAISMVIPVNVFYVFAMRSLKDANSRIAAVISVGKLAIGTIGFQMASYFYTNDFRSTGHVMLFMQLLTLWLIFYLLQKNQNCKSDIMN